MIMLALLASLTLAWDPNTEPDIAGYRLYCGEASGRYIASIDVGNVTQFQPTLKNLNPGDTAFFVVTAYNTSGLESDFSNEVSYTKPALPQPKLEIHLHDGLVTLLWLSQEGLYYRVLYRDSNDEPWQATFASRGDGNTISWTEVADKPKRIFRLEVTE